MFTRSQEEPQKPIAPKKQIPRKGAAHIQYKAIAARPAPQLVEPHTAVTVAEGSALQPAVSAAAHGEQSTADLTSLFSLDADDSLIQELLAGIPSTAWLPTDPLTSEDWFPDPSSSIITQDTPQQFSGLYSVGHSTPTLALQARSSALQPGVASLTTTPDTSALAAEHTLDVATSIHASATPDTRLLANMRAKRETPLMSRHCSKRSNPLHGFAKKHGVGYAVGNQMALISPELLSSSPPNAKQLRQNPYKYYSPPKHLLPRAKSQTKGRNLMFGKSHPLSDQPNSTQRPSGPQSQLSTSRARSGQGVIKWEIAQDKQLLCGVRFQRWKNGAAARDPNQFTAKDWEQIAECVNVAGVVRSARQCRRRWAVMHAHLGATIMDFVDSTPTPQSSAHNTPVPPGSLTPRACAGESALVPRHVRNLQFAGLPKSSPPLMPSGLRPREPSVMTMQSSPPLPVLPEVASIDLETLDLEKRWTTPAYCQLLTDIVQALTSPDSQAAAVVRKHMDSRSKTPARTVAAEPRAASAATSKTSKTPRPLAPSQPRIQPRTSQAKGTRVVSGSSTHTPASSVLPAIAAKPAPVTKKQAKAAAGSSQSPAIVTQKPAAVTQRPAVVTQKPALAPQQAIAGSAPSTEPISNSAVVQVADMDLGAIDQDMNMYLEFIQSLTKDQIGLSSAWNTLFDGSTLPLNSSTAVPIASHATVPAAVPAVGALPLTTSTISTPGVEAKQSGASGIDDDDANDDDFVLDDDDFDDDDDDDFDDEEQLFGRAQEKSSVALAGPSATNSSWDLTLKQLGLDTSDVSFPNVLSGGLQSMSKASGSDLLSDEMLQELIQGVTDVSGASESVGASQSWLAGVGANGAALPVWGSAGLSLGIDALQSDAGASVDPAAALAPAALAPTTCETPARSDGVQGETAGCGPETAQPSQLQKLMTDMVAPKRGSSKTTRKRKKASIVKALSSAAALMDMEAGEGMDTEMSGLYQEALQEGEEIDVHEESLQTDNSGHLFTAEQMAQLREQQLGNFQIVTQAFLITCAEVGPHAERARHWKQQLDQLALWHSLGTRESPSDVLSRGGLNRFSELLASAERHRQRTGAVGVAECGRFAPNPGSFFAIPGITAVVPDIYEAVDEIHRAAQLSNDHDKLDPDARSKARRRSQAQTCEVRSFDGSMQFTAQCKCTAIQPHEFKSALMLESVFPRMYLQMHSGKRKAAEVEGDERAGGAVKQQALLPASTPRAEGTGPVKPLAPLVRPISRQRSVPDTSDTTPVSNEGPPAYTQADVRILVEEMKSQMRWFKREIHRIPRTRRRVFVQGSDGVPRQDWLRVEIKPLALPMPMQCLLAPLFAHCGFRESMQPQIVVVRKPKNRIHFLDTEDSLLYLGLRLFGLEDVASIRVHMLPCKTASQLRNRMNNLRARRAPPNLVKEHCLRRIAPFTLEEEETLRVGVMVYGDEFKQLNRSFLGNRPVLALTHVWNHMRNPPDSD
ncbi:hypothetical protein IWW56_002157 [Coemansia sp. RSA 2131]|nr:hypothetical protein IWW56_002157 [Coemansia sp. RSA 2131]